MLTNPMLSPTEAVQFYNTSTHKSIWFDLTKYLDQYSLFRSFACLILLHNKNTQGFALLNPFMRSITQLPSKIESDCPKAPKKLEDIIDSSLVNRLSDVCVTSSSTIVLIFSKLDYLVWTRPGDGNWVYVEFEIMCWSNVMFSDDWIFAVDPDRGVVQIDLSNEMISQPQLEVVVSDGCFEDAQHLIHCNGNIFMVSFIIDYYDEQRFWESFEMCKLDLKNETRVISENLGGCSIFLSEKRTFSVSSRKGLVPANCIYFCNQYYGKHAWYNLRTSRLKFSSKKPFLCPNPLVEKLINYCL